MASDLVYLFALLLWLGWCLYTIARKRLWDLRTFVLEPSPAQPFVYFFTGVSCWLAGAFASTAVYALTIGNALPENELWLNAIVGGSANLGTLVMAAFIFTMMPPLLSRTVGLGLTWAKGTGTTALIAFAIICPLALASAIGAQQAAILISEVLGNEPPDRLAHSTLRLLADPEMTAHLAWWLTVLVVVIGAPLTEELIYRGFIQTSIIRATRSNWIGIAVTSVLFMLIHWGTVDLQAMVGEAGLNVEPVDLVREIAIYAEKTDIAEELQRLGGHIEQFSEMIENEDERPIGRTLDFLAQEMLREANTIASKSADSGISRLIVEIKGAIDRIKEQVQNAE